MMQLQTLYFSFVLFNFIQASATFSQGRSSIVKNVIDLQGDRLKKLKHQPDHYQRKQPVGGGRSSTSLLDIRGGGGKDEDQEDDSFDLLNDILPSSLRELVEETISSQRKIVVVTGGVLSGIGKGVTASSIGVLLRAMGLRVTALKIDPYLNVDAGTMSPFEHGEVFVLDDGGETDLDLGNYERFLSVSLTKESNLSTGKIYQVRKETI